VPQSKLPFSYLAAQSIKQFYTDFDIVHFMDIRDGFFVPSRKTRKCGPNIIGTIHDFYSAISSINPAVYQRDYAYDWPFKYFYYNMNNVVEKKATSRFDRLIAVCKYTAERIESAYQVSSSKIDIVYNGIDDCSCSEFRDRYRFSRENRPNDSPLLLYTGANYQRKGVTFIIKSLPQIVKKFPLVHINIAGSDPHQSKFSDLAKKMGVRENVSFLGRISTNELYRLFSSSDLFLMPSLYESFSFALLESMSFGTPPIAGNIGGSDELILDGENGFLVNPYVYSEIADAVCEALDDEQKWRSLSLNCYKSVKKFNTKRMIDETIRVYHNVLQSS
jgi:glycosyltransferase involved in cell wall biosynthesis